MTVKTEMDFVAHALRMTGVESRVLTPGEALVGTGFRSWLRGYQSGDFACWQRCWDLYCGELSGSAQAAVTDLASWVNAVRCCGLRDIELLPEDCRAFGRDECLAVTLVAASEHRHCPAMRLCANLLLGTDNIEPTLSSAHRFSQTLARGGVRFAPEPPALTPARPRVLH
jgi:hypothetical protein